MYGLYRKKRCFFLNLPRAVIQVTKMGLESKVGVKGKAPKVDDKPLQKQRRARILGHGKTGQW